MPTYTWLTFCGALIALSAGSVRAEEADNPLAGFDEYANAALADFRTPGMAVAIVKDGEVILARGYGVCRAGGSEPVDEHTIFPIASITKVFTATCLATLVEEGKLGWNDPVVRHLPEFKLHDPYVTRDVRIADLLSHRTGLETADLLAYRGDYDREEILRRLEFVQPIAPFRSRYNYNNLMVVTAGEVVERISGRPWTTFVDDRVFQPLGMTRTYASPRPLVDLENVSTPHILSEEQAVPDPLWNRDSGEGFRRLHEAVAPAGAIQSNAVDMAKFLQLYLNEGQFDDRRLLQVATVREMFAPHSVVPIKAAPEPRFAYPRFFFGCGLSWWLRDYHGRKIVYHGGSSGAVAAMMPEEGIGVVVLANRGSGVVYMVMHDVFDRLLGMPRPWTNQDWLGDADVKPRESIRAKNAELEASRAKDTSPSLPLEEYAGTYECDLYGKLEIRQAEGALRLQFGPNIHATLGHWEHDSFRAKLNFPSDDEWLMTFHVVDGTSAKVTIKRIFWHESMPEFVRVESADASGG